jgi:alpha-tubulin suppressor-like RCC1 family protein
MWKKIILGIGSFVLFVYFVQVTDILAKMLPSSNDQYTYYQEIDVSDLSLENNRTTILSTDGSLYTFGYNSYNQLLSNESGAIPNEVVENVPLNENEFIVDIATGLFHSGILTSDGNLYMWGYNTYGQLGDGTETSSNQLINITNNFDLAENEMIVSISLGRFHSAALTNLGSVYTWGTNIGGALGNDSSDSSSLPVNITDNFILNENEMIDSIQISRYYSGVTTNQGRVFMWGYNSAGQVGDGTTTSVYLPLDITSNFNLSNDETISDLVLGFDHAGVITSENRILLWGANTTGALGDGTNKAKSLPVDITSNLDLYYGEEIVDFDLGNGFTLVVTNYGHVFSFGSNESGQLGDGSIVNSLSPIEITDQFLLDQGEKIVSIEAGYSHVVAVTNMSKIWSWGYNEYGQVGVDSAENQVNPQNISEIFESISIAENQSYLEQSNILSMDMDSKTAYILDSFTVSIFPQVEINHIESVTISGIVYDSSMFTNIDGRIDVTIENTWSLGNTINFTLDAITLDTDVNLVLSGDLHTSTTLIEDTSSPVLIFEYDQALYVEKGLGDDTYLPAVFAIDDFTSNPEVNISQDIDWDTIGTYTVDYISSDSSGNEIQVTKVVNVIPDVLSDGDIYDGMQFFGLEEETYVDDTNISDQYIRFDGSDFSSISEYDVSNFTTVHNQLEYVYYVGYRLVYMDKDLFYFNSNGPSFDIIETQVIEAGTSDVDWTTLMLNVSDLQGDNYSLNEVSDTVTYDLPGTYTVQVQAIDTLNNENNLMFQVIVEDTIAPNYIIENQVIEAGTSDIDWTNYVSSITDNAQGDFLITEVSDLIIYDTLGTYNVTVSVQDESLNTLNKTIQVQVIDTSSPSFDIQENRTIEAGDTSIDFTSYMINIEDNASGHIQLSETLNLVDYNTPGTYDVTVEATDESNNSYSMTFSIIVVDTSAPSFTVPQSLTIEAGSEALDFTSYISNVEDNSDGTLSEIETSNTVDYRLPGTYSVTLRVSDESGNQSQETIQIIIEDTSAPSFSVSDTSIEAGLSGIDWTTYAVNITDNSNTEVTVSLVEDTVIYNQVGSYTVTLQVSDASQNVATKTMTVYVVDTTAPLVTVEDIFIEAGLYESLHFDSLLYIASITDNSDSEFTIEEIYNQVDFDHVGTYTVKLEVSDEYGNTSSVDLNIVIIDTTPPDFLIEDEMILEASQENTFDWTSLIKDITDNADAEVTDFTVIDEVDYNTPGTYTISLEVTDNAGNTSQKDLDVIIVDTVAPSFTLDQENLEAGSVDSLESVITIIENTDGLITYEENGIIDYDMPGNYILSITLTDESGNSKTLIVSIDILDTSAPEVTLNPSIDTLYQGQVYLEYGVSVSDVSTYTVETIGSVDTSILGTTIITYIVTDAYGNYSISKRVVTVLEQKSSPNFELEEGLTTLEIGQEYIEAGCQVQYQGTSLPCSVQVSTLDITTSGTYTITYEVVIDDVSYTYKRYIFVVSNESEEE